MSSHHAPHRAHAHSPQDRQPSHSHSHQHGHHQDYHGHHHARQHYEDYAEEYHHPRRGHRGHGGGGFRGRIARINRVLFRKPSGRISWFKVACISIVSLGGIYVLLVRGLVPFDLASPFIESALERQLGPGHRVSIGRTRLDHDRTGAPILKISRIRVRGAEGKLLASAPSAEVGLDAASLLMGTFRAKRIDLVGAQTTVHVGHDGRVAITTGQDAAPITAGPDGQVETESASRPLPAQPRAEPFHYPQFVRWLNSFEKSGLDGVYLTQIGLKEGTLTVENATTGRRWEFKDINVQLSRPSEGGALFSLRSSASSSGGRPWEVTATIAAPSGNSRAIDIVARDISPGDLLLAAGFGNFDLLVDTPLSGVLRARISEDGRLIEAYARASASPGVIGSITDADARFPIDDFQLQARYDPERRATIVDTLGVRFGQNHIVGAIVVEAPRTSERIWNVTVPNALLSLSTGRPGETPLVMDRVNVRASYDSVAQRFTVHQGDIAGSTASGAFSGSVTLGANPMLQLGLAATQMPVTAAKRLWPAIVARGSRSWAMERVENGVIDKIVVALNVPLEVVGKADVELPDNSVRFEMSASGGVFRPAEKLPLIRDAQVSVVVTGRTARVVLNRGVIDTPNGRRINLSDGQLEVQNHAPPNPSGTIRFRYSGSAEAVADMAATELLKDQAGFVVDPATARGSVSGNLRLSLVFRKDIQREEVDYVAEGDLSNFSADKILRGQRVDSVNAKVTVTPDLAHVRGEGRIAGAPSVFDYRKSKARNEAEFRVTSTLNDESRARLGVDLLPWLSGPVIVKASGRTNEQETRIDVDNDLTQAKVNDLVPGWQKPAGAVSRATFRLIDRGDKVRFEDLNVTGSGTTLKGVVELEADGDFIAANLPTFHLSDGDRASLNASRTSDGALRVTVKGDVLDARGAIRGLTEGQSTPPGGKTYKPRDLDLELRIGAARGNNGEVARNLDMRLVRRNGEVRSFSLVGRVGRDASMVGELRARDGKPAIVLTSGDAGAMFRFADFYNKIYGGQSTLVIDAPSADGTPQQGTVDVRDFVIRGEPALERVQQAGGPADHGGTRASREQGTAFIILQAEFNRTPGKFSIREASIYGPTVGATVEGVLDYSGNSVHLTGTYIPAFSLNVIVPNIPLIGPFIAPKDGLYAVPFEIVGPASKPTLRVNAIGGAIPGHFRRLFEFQRANRQQFPQ